MSGDPLRDLDGATRIHVFGDARRTEGCDNKLVLGFHWPSPVSQPALKRSDDPGVSSSMFHDSWQRKETGEHLDLKPGKSVQAKDRPLL